MWSMFPTRLTEDSCTAFTSQLQYWQTFPDFPRQMICSFSFESSAVSNTAIFIIALFYFIMSLSLCLPLGCELYGRRTTPHLFAGTSDRPGTQSAQEIFLGADRSWTSLFTSVLLLICKLNIKIVNLLSSGFLRG